MRYLLLCLAVVLPNLAVAKQPPSELADLVEKLLPAVVNVINVSYVPVDAAAPNGRLMRKTSFGSGFVIDAKGLIATNRHVIDNGSEYYITFYDGRRLRADLVARAVGIDLALLKARTTVPLPTVKIGTAEGLRRGDGVIAIGNPLGYSSSVSTGIISAFDRDLGMGKLDHFLQTDAEINQGNSGGPLFNMAGEVIGINSAILTVSGSTGSVGIGFAIPIDDAVSLGNQIEKYGRPRPAWLGAEVADVSNDLAETLGLPAPEGAIVTEIDANSPAASVRLRPGDVILKVNAKTIGNTRAFYRAIVAHPFNTPGTVEIWRDGKREMFEVAYGEYPDAKGLDPFVNTAPGHPPPKPSADLGLTLTAAANGAVVKAVAPGSVADFEHIAPGETIIMVQDDLIIGPGDLRKRLDMLRAAGVKMARVLVSGTDGRRWVAMQLQ